MSDHAATRPPANRRSASSPHSAPQDSDAEPASPLIAWLTDDTSYSDPSAAAGLFDYYADDAVSGARPRDATPSNAIPSQSPHEQLRLLLANAANVLAPGSTAALRPEPISAMRAEIATASETLQASLRAPAIGGDRAQVKALLLDAQQTIDRLTSLERSVAARSSLGVSSGPAGVEATFAAAEAKAGLGYCDLPSTPQGVAPCQLGPSGRAPYRAKVTDVIKSAQTNWLLAINAIDAEKKYKAQPKSFEHQLGNILVSFLFQSLELVAAAAASKLVGAVSKSAAASIEEYPGVGVGIAGPSASAAAEPGALVRSGIKQGFKQGTEPAKQGLRVSAGEINQRASALAQPNGTTFMQRMKSVPTRWGASILADVYALDDEALAAYYVSLPAATQLDQAYFEAKVRAALAAFETQVAKINPDKRAVKVMNERGVMRTALVTSEMKMAEHLGSDVRSERVRTGKWDFVQWVDAELAPMALARSASALALPVSGGALGVNEIRRSNDLSYWSIKSLPALWAFEAGHEPPTADELVASSDEQDGPIASGATDAE